MPHFPTRVALPTTLLFLLMACGGEPDPPVLGVAATETFIQAVTLAVEDAVEAGPMPPFDTAYVLDWSVRSAPALDAAGELVAIPGMAAVIGHSNSSASIAASQIYNTREVVQIAPTSTAPLYSEVGPFSFRMVPPDTVQGATLARRVARRFPDGGAVALLYVNDDYGRGLRGALLPHLDPDVHPVVLDLPHYEDDLMEGEDPLEGEIGGLDVERTVCALEDAEPDVILWLGRPERLNRILPHLQGPLSHVPILGSDGLSRAPFLEDAVPEWERVRYLEFVDMEATPELRRFRERYLERFESPGVAAEALAYDAARMILEAFRAGARTGPEVRAFLMEFGRSSLPYAGLTGEVVFTEEGDVERGYVTDSYRPGEAP